jgi:hypothetical protein
MLRISREKARQEALDQINYAKTCVLARELCLIIRTHRAVLEKRDITYWCSFISGLCKEAGCKEAGALCAKAAGTVLESEEKYLSLCEHSCRKCSELRTPKKHLLGKAMYVA